MAPAFIDPNWGALSPVGQRRSCSHNKKDVSYGNP